MSWEEQHTEWITGRVRAWFAGEHQDWIAAKLREIGSENTRAVADGYDGNNGPYRNSHGPYNDDDIDALGDMAEQFMLSVLVPVVFTIADEFAVDCISEVEWLELAASWLSEGQSGD